MLHGFGARGHAVPDMRADAVHVRGRVEGRCGRHGAGEESGKDFPIAAAVVGWGEEGRAKDVGRGEDGRGDDECADDDREDDPPGVGVEVRLAVVLVADPDREVQLVGKPDGGRRGKDRRERPQVPQIVLHPSPTPPQLSARPPPHSRLGPREGRRRGEGKERRGRPRSGGGKVP